MQQYFLWQCSLSLPKERIAVAVHSWSFQIVVGRKDTQEFEDFVPSLCVEVAKAAAGGKSIVFSRLSAGSSPAELDSPLSAQWELVERVNSNILETPTSSELVLPHPPVEASSSTACPLHSLPFPPLPFPPVLEPELNTLSACMCLSVCMGGDRNHISRETCYETQDPARSLVVKPCC